MLEAKFLQFLQQIGKQVKLYLFNFKHEGTLTLCYAIKVLYSANTIYNGFLSEKKKWVKADYGCRQRNDDDDDDDHLHLLVNDVITAQPG